MTKTWDEMSTTTTALPIPPVHLRERVHGAGDVESFWAVGACAAGDIMQALAASSNTSTHTTHRRSVLDFGCGCGRVLPFMLNSMPHVQFSAADIDAEAIAWVREAYPTVRAITTQDMPPLPYRHSSFDLIYAVSVWTHLDEARQHAWLAEMRRILRPGGLLIASLHGERAASRMMDHGTWEQIAAQGFYYVAVDLWRDVFPPWYGLAWHTPAYVARVWGAYFTVRSHIPAGLNDNHDLVVLERGDD